MEIKILGTGCAGCKALYATVEKAMDELDLKNVRLVKEEDIVEIMKYNVMSLPAIVVDGRVVSQGRKPNIAEVKNLLSK